MAGFERYAASLRQLSRPYDPTACTEATEEIRALARQLEHLPTLDRSSLARFIRERPEAVPMLALAVGLTLEKLRGVLKHHCGTGGWIKLARDRPDVVVAMLDDHYGLVELVAVQRNRSYRFGDILVERAGTRRAATDAGATGRLIEDEIETVARNLGLSYAVRTRFVGRHRQTAPADLLIPADGSEGRVIVAAKGFDSTGSKLTDAVREVEEMAEKRLPSQYVMAVVDGIGWRRREADLRRIYQLWETRQIDGLYTLGHIDQFRGDLHDAARRIGLL
jgi:hypothetical protein